jgi:mycothiol synthase
VSGPEIAHWLSLDAYMFWVAERDGEIVAYADLDERPGRERYWLDLRALAPEGASALLSEAEAWARPRAADGALVHAIVPTVDRTTGAVLESIGYRHVRYDLEMRIQLQSEPPEPVWPDGMAVRAFRPGDDDEEAWRAAMESFEDHWEYSPDPLDTWLKEVLGHPDFDPSLFFLPVDGDEVAGLAYCLLRQLDEPVGWVQILGVRRRWRRRGLGLALLHHSFRELRLRGAAWAGLEVDAESLTGAVRLYERAGMRPVRQASFYARGVVP